MKKGFTLLELIVVIIIIGVLATLGLTQYQRMIERARGAEARQIIGAIRTNVAAICMSRGNNCSSADNTQVGVGTDYPGSTAAGCAPTHYFWYNLSGVTATGFTATATRCTANGKTPQGATAGTLSLTTDFTAGTDVWGTSGEY